MKSSTAPTQKSDLYQRVTDRILLDLSSGTRPWVKPWTATASGPLVRPCRHGGEPYRGINVLLLWAEASARGFASCIWMTYRQAQELGGQVRREETGTGVVYASTYKKADNTGASEEEEQATYCDSYVSVPGSKPTAWVECVKLDGKWWDVRDIFSSTFCDQLDAALCALEDFSLCAP